MSALGVATSGWCVLQNGEPEGVIVKTREMKRLGTPQQCRAKFSRNPNARERVSLPPKARLQARWP